MTFRAGTLQKALRICEVNSASDEYLAVICDLNNHYVYMKSMSLKCVFDDLECHNKLFSKAMGWNLCIL